MKEDYMMSTQQSLMFSYNIIIINHGSHDINENEQINNIPYNKVSMT